MMIHILTIHNVGSQFMEQYADYLVMNSRLRWRLSLVGNDVKVYCVYTDASNGMAYHYAVASLPPQNNYNFSAAPAHTYVHPSNV